jgi:hypothetical protein
MQKNNLINTLILMGFLLAACQSADIGNPIPTASSVSDDPYALSDDSQSSNLEAAPTPLSEVINPLTGLPAADPALLDRRPVMVKVSNFPRLGRPHAGLSFADIVFDYYIGYITVRIALPSAQFGPVAVLIKNWLASIAVCWHTGPRIMTRMKNWSLPWGIMLFQILKRPVRHFAARVRMMPLAYLPIRKQSVSM